MLTSSRIKTCTFFAICCLYIISTTISTIPFTSTIVVLIITPVVTFPVRGTTAIGAWSRSWSRRCRFFTWIKTFAFFAILGFYIIATTISTIPCTSTIVVFIITIVVAFPTFITTFFSTARRWWGWGRGWGWWWWGWCWRFSTNIPNLSY